MTDLDKTLEELENDTWGEPKFDSHVVTECHRIRRVRLGELTHEDLRLAISQAMGLPYLLPVALARLRAEPLAAGDFFEGDLFLSLLRVPDHAWKAKPGLREELMMIATRFFTQAASLDASWHATYAPEVRAAYLRFMGESAG
jgi:hypothetical protein